MRERYKITKQNCTYGEVMELGQKHDGLLFILGPIPVIVLTRYLTIMRNNSILNDVLCFQVSCIMSTPSFTVGTCSKALEAVGCVFNDIWKPKAWIRISSNGMYLKKF